MNINKAIDDGVTVSAKLMIEQQFQAKKISLNNLYNSSSAISGLHNSIFHGRGMEYQESRIYQNGDDIRNMDWKVTAKTGKPHIKLFQEERERPTYIVINANSSMIFGTKKQFKSVLAAKVSALFGWASIKNGDRVGVVTYGINGITIKKALSGKNGMMQLVSQTVAAYNKKETSNNITNLDDALQQLRKIVHHSSNIIIVSDFQQMGENSKKHLTMLRKYNDILAIYICDPFEIYKSSPALYGIAGNNKSITIDVRKESTQQQLGLLQSNLIDNLQENLIKNRIPVIPVQTNSIASESLKKQLKNPYASYHNWINEINNE